MCSTSMTIKLGCVLQRKQRPAGTEPFDLEGFYFPEPASCFIIGICQPENSINEVPPLGRYVDQSCENIAIKSRLPRVLAQINRAFFFKEPGKGDGSY